MFDLKISPTEARRTAVAAQHLSGPYPEPTKEAMLKTLKQIRCLQLDPIRAVERTQYLVLWSRLGNYDREHLHELVYEDRHLFEYWAHAASIVLVEDFPLHGRMMRNYGKGGSSWSKRLAAWVQDNQEFRDYILSEIERNGPMLTQEFEDKTKVPWSSSGWSAGRSVSYMIDYLWSSGRLAVAKRDGLKRWWDLSERVMPEWAPQEEWTAEQATYDAVQKSLLALGVGRVRDIKRHFIENRYPKINKVMSTLLGEEKVLPVQIEGWADDWCIHRDNLPTLRRIQEGTWQPRTTLLSPFDGLVRDRDRTELMWDFYYRIEIYVPKAKRQYGYYVLPILHGEKLIGRIDSKMDRKKHVYNIHAVYTEPGVELDEATGQAVAGAIGRLGDFLGAKRVAYGENVPQPWKHIFEPTTAH